MSKTNSSNAFFWAVWSLFAREVLRFLRQRSRIIGALVAPMMFWVLLGSGFGRSFQPPSLSEEIHYATYFFPGVIMMVVLFTAIFASISIIEDRNEGFLQGVLVAPVSRLAIVLGKVLGGAFLGTLQGMLILLLAPFIGITYDVLQFFQALGVIFLSSLGLSGLGFFLAWRMDSVQGFHAMMNILLFPMWLMSGAFFPAAGASMWVQILMMGNPMAYGLAAMRRVLQGPELSNALGEFQMTSSIIGMVVFVVVMLVMAAMAASRPEKA